MKCRQWFKHLLLAVALSMFVVADVSAERIMVSLGSGALRDMSFYGVKECCFDSPQQTDDFAATIKDARIFFVGPGSSSDFQRLIADSANKDAIAAFLKNGGVIWFDGMSFDTPAIRQYLATLGIDTPVISDSPAARRWVVNPQSKSHFLTTPKAQTDEVRHTFNCMTDWSAGLEPIFIEIASPDESALLLAQNVLGKGNIFLAITRKAWAQKTKDCDSLITNILTYAFGPLPAPGKTFKPVGIFERRSPAANTTVLANAEKTEWHVSDAAQRKIILVSEPIGMARPFACVEFDWPEANARNDSVRAFTISGVELVAQALGDDRYAVSVPLRPYDDLLVYIYVGGNSKPDIRDNTDKLTIEQGRLGWTLRNGYFEALLGANSPVLRCLRPLGGSTKNIFQSWGNSERWFGYGTNFSVWNESAQAYTDAHAELIADGPVRKTIRYTIDLLKTGQRTIEISLIRGAAALFFTGHSDVDDNPSLWTGWCLGGSISDGWLWYQAPEGLKRLGPIIIKPASQYSLTPHASEAWYAIADDTAGLVAGAFSLPDAQGRMPVNYTSHLIFGQLITQKFSFGNQGDSGGWVAATGGPEKVRDAYLDWKNPPLVTPAAQQTRQDYSLPPRPKLGRDFLRMQGPFRRYKPRNARAGLDVWADSAVSTVIELAGNVLEMGNHGNCDDYAPTVAEAHRRGLAVCLKPNLRKLGCMVANHDKYIEAARVQTQYDAEMFYLVDEHSHTCLCDSCAAKFKADTGLEMPRKWDLTKLADPTAFKNLTWHFDVFSDVIREMDRIVKADHPDATTFVVSNPAVMGYEMPKFNDFDAWDSLGSTSSDLYMPDLDYIRFGIQYIRGGQGNDKPVLMVHGNDRDDPANNYINLGGHLLSGANALWYFQISDCSTGKDFFTPVLKGYELLRDTQLGDLLAQGRLARYAVVLFDKGSFLEGMRRAELANGRRPKYHVYVNNQALLRNVPVDVLWDKHLSRELKKYKVLVVPSGRNMTPANAQLISDWVRNGGNVIVQGEALLNETLAEICGVTVTDKIKGDAISMLLKGASILTETKRKPVVTSNRFGSGTAVAISMINPDQDVVRPLVIDLGGQLPIDLDAAHAQNVRIAAITDGQRTAIGVLNESTTPARAITIKLGDIAPEATSRIVTNMHTGVRQAVTDGVIELDLPARTWQFLIVEDADAVDTMPVPGNPTSGPGYALTSGSAACL